jgi:hypothetical protein
MKAVGINLLALIIGVATPYAQTVRQPSTKRTVILRGRVERVEIRPEDSPSKYAMTPVYITLKLSIINTGKAPLIFLRREPDCNQAVIAKNADELDIRNRKFLAYSGRGSSEITSKKWANLHKSLNRALPPSALTRILAPGESFDFDGLIRLDLPKEPAMYASSPTRSESLTRLQELSPVLLKVRCDPWPLNLDGVNNGRHKLKFGRELQLKWKHFGWLWLDDIYSEPITLDLKK